MKSSAPVKVLSLHLPVELYAEVEASAKRHYLPVSTHIRSILAEYVQDNKTTPKPSNTKAKPALSPADEILARRTRRAFADQTNEQLRAAYIEHKKAVAADPKNQMAQFAMSSISTEMGLRAEEDAEAESAV